jgi:hypothetical protein
LGISKYSGTLVLRNFASSCTRSEIRHDDIFRNLVSYLKQKEAAGVITLSNPQTEQTGVLYAFPPCPFR